MRNDLLPERSHERTTARNSNAGWGEKPGTTMAVPDVRRLLQVVLAVAAPRNVLAHAIALSA